jgi:hypothetical protein
MQHEHGSRTLAQDQVALPITGLNPAIDRVGPVVNGGSVLERVA